MGLPILAVPCVEKGRGGGHLVRSAALVRDLRARGREAFLYLPGSEGIAGIAPHLSPFLKDIDPGRIISGQKAVAAKQWAFIILDRFSTPAEEYPFWSSLAPLIGIDEGGSCRDDFDFLIDLLPGPPRRSGPNILDLSLLPLPKNRRPHPWETPQAPACRLPPRVKFSAGQAAAPLKVLISFGTEDLAGLGKRCQALFSNPHLALTLLGGAAGQRIPNLSEHLAEYDLLITHFGLTAFEAIYAGTPVLLVSPGAYHEKLSRSAGFISAGIGKRGVRRASRLLARKSGSRETALNPAFFEKLNRNCQKIAEKYGLSQTPERSFADLAETISPHLSRAAGGVHVCPACGAQSAATGPHPVSARFPDRTYRRCPGCGMVYMNRLNPPPIEYEREYFFDFYKKQYGKTYIEDFPNLINMGKKRLALIKSLLAHSGSPVSGGTAGPLLDIGCAYGPFLQAGRAAGFEPTGIDPAGDAVAYVKKELGLPAFQGFFPETTLPEVLKDSAFSAVTLWYVIEHFRSPRTALEECRRILMPGGVLAFSTPSFQGISSRKSPRSFLENSPADHWTVWSPGRCKKLLKKAGFTLKKIVVTGRHPERFPFIGNFIGQKRGPVYQFLILLSRIFGLGDTFEVYAIKDSI
ncbi:hypothetical protein AGMMS49587_03060 [Spirochaetia bacterium]|nr:hypothetical protein AGMMS49587_03060 [Spirochaetia bacterium]